MLDKDMLDKCLNKKKSELVLKNGNVINVFTNKIEKMDIAIDNGIIVGLGDYQGETEIDINGKYVCSGFIDAHMHIESAMVNPKTFVNCVNKWGTTTLITDPHELANVCGIKGIEYILDETQNVDCNVFVMLPSCVPATSFESNGCSLLAKDMEKLILNPRVIGLGEVMDYVSVINAEQNMLDKLKLFEDKVIDGHSPELSLDILKAYKLSGVNTDHECSTGEQALTKLDLGFYVLIRQGSAAKNLENIIKYLLENNINFDRCGFCTDDKHIEDIKNEGHISYNIKKAIEVGVNPIEAIKMATINIANCYNLKKMGAVALGYKADLVVLDNLEKVEINSVYFNGKLLDSDIKLNLTKPDDCLLNTIKISKIEKEMLEIKIKDENSVIELVPFEITTRHIKEKLICNIDIFVPYDDYLKIVVVERHNKTGNIGVGIIKDFGLKNGAIGSTVAHDSHNIIIIGDNDKDILNCIKHFEKTGGGYVISSQNKILESLELEIGGLITNLSEDEVQDKLHKMIEISKKLGIKSCYDPFITMSFLALPVIPEIRITDKGLFDVKSFKFIN